MAAPTEVGMLALRLLILASMLVTATTFAAIAQEEEVEIVEDEVEVEVEIIEPPTPRPTATRRPTSTPRPAPTSRPRPEIRVFDMPPPPPIPTVVPMPSLQIQGEQARRERSGDYIVITGEVRNTGTIAANFVRVTVTFYDSNRNVVDTDFTYVDAPSYILGPGQVAPFKLTSRYQRTTATYRLTTSGRAE